ncbi:MAG TPA: ABC transporter substrate-binding protein [Limnochordia bacterium]
MGRQGVLRSWLVRTLGLTVLALGGLAGAAQGKVTIYIAYPHSGASEASLKQVIADFNASQGEIEALGQYVPYSQISQEKLQVMVAGGQPPDVALLADLLVAQYAAVDGLIPLDPYLTRDGIRPDEFWPSSWRVGNWQGHHWAMPHTQDARALFINLDHLESAGLDAVHGPRTLDELVSFTRKLTERNHDGTLARLGFAPWVWEGWFYTWGWLFGGDFYDAAAARVTVNEPRLVEAMSWLADFARNVVTPAEASTAADFFQQRMSMVVAGNWTLADIKRNVPDLPFGVVPIPPPAGRGLSTWSGIWTMVIPRGAPHPDAAWEFIKFAVRGRAAVTNAIISSAVPGHIPAAREAVRVLSEEYGRQYETFLELMPYSHERPTMPVGSLMWDKLAEAMNDVIAGRQAPAAALDNANRQIQAALDEAMARWRADH